jgi:AraC family transcriptional regulator of arabinose operon
VTEQVGRLQLADNQLTEFDALFLDIEETHKQLRPMSEQLAMNLLERLLIRCYEASSQNAYPAIDHRVHEACQILSESLSAEISVEALADRCSCLPRASRTCFASRWG